MLVRIVANLDTNSGFVTWRSAESGTFVVFAGEDGHTYAFCSVARKRGINTTKLGLANQGHRGRNTLR